MGVMVYGCEVQIDIRVLPYPRFPRSSASHLQINIHLFSLISSENYPSRNQF